mgnify:CR=1 FL=1
MTPSQTMDFIANYGVEGILVLAFFCAVFMWKLERGERLDAQRELAQISRDSTKAITTINVLVGHLISVFRPNGQSGNGQ